MRSSGNVGKRQASSRSFRPEAQGSIGSIGGHGYAMLVST